VKLAMLGTLDAATANEVLLDAEPSAVVTLIGPVIAPDGTVATSCVAVADVTVAPTPPNATVLALAAVLNPVPYTVTAVPAAADAGANRITETAAELCRATESKFPTASNPKIAVSLAGSVTATKRPTES
jgi:hypothetical protein